ncbi:hypothetical protein VNO78_15387 [Psophocarpus tetragonolobus]|uniref:Uncharacterized protein n=1 Tax=Psophocarpus tetragonolobus TaxID=3891 RepID=A0AAN9SEI5_PSOTE
MDLNCCLSLLWSTACVESRPTVAAYRMVPDPNLCPYTSPTCLLYLFDLSRVWNMAEAVLEVVRENLNSLLQKELGIFPSFDEDLKRLASLFTTIKATLAYVEEQKFSNRSIKTKFHLTEMVPERRSGVVKGRQSVKLPHSSLNLKCMEEKKKKDKFVDIFIGDASNHEDFSLAKSIFMMWEDHKIIEEDIFRLKALKLQSANGNEENEMAQEQRAKTREKLEEEALLCNQQMKSDSTTYKG